MVAMGIKGSGNEGLKSQPWTNQTPAAGWEGFFAGASNIIFTFGALATPCIQWTGYGRRRHSDIVWFALAYLWTTLPAVSERPLGRSQCNAGCSIRARSPWLPAGGHAMLLEVMDSMFKPYKFHKVPGSVLVSCCLFARLNVAAPAGSRSRGPHLHCVGTCACTAAQEPFWPTRLLPHCLSRCSTGATPMYSRW